MARHLPLLTTLSLALAAPLAAQDPPPPPDAPTDTLVAPETPAEPAEVEFTGIDPRTAFIRSLVLPGWGQASVGVPLRGAVYFGMEAGSLWMLHKARTRLRHARDRDELLRLTGQLGATERSEVTGSRRREVEDWLTLSIFTLFFSAADAYVAAWLQDFDAEVGVLPEPDGGLRFEIGVPVGRR